MELCDFFLIFKDFLRISVMFLNVDVCDIVLITSESTDYEFLADIFIELLKFWCEVLTVVLGCMRMFDDSSGAQLAGRRRGGGLPCSFLKIQKNCPNNGKKCPDCFHPWIKCSSMLSYKRAPMFWEHLGGKTPKLPPPSDFFYML